MRYLQERRRFQQGPGIEVQTRVRILGFAWLCQSVFVNKWAKVLLNHDDSQRTVCDITSQLQALSTASVHPGPWVLKPSRCEGMSLVANIALYYGSNILLLKPWIVIGFI
jgi:hypothetical protein